VLGLVVAGYLTRGDPIELVALAKILRLKLRHSHLVSIVFLREDTLS